MSSATAPSDETPTPGTAMNGVPKEILRAAYQRRNWPLVKIPMAYATWAGLGYLLYATQDHRFAIPIGIASSILIAYLIRGLGAIAHDAVHGNVSRNKTITYWVSLLCWSPTGMSVTIYSNYHLHHHRIANTYPDVDNFVVTDYTRNPVLAKMLLLAVYTFGYPIYFMFAMFRYIKRLSAWERVRMNLELAGIFGLVAVGFYMLPTHVMIFLYGVPFLLGSFFASMTSMIEHYGMDDTSDDAYSSRTYGIDCKVTNFIWNNVCFHNEHHKYPGIPWYNLESFHHAAYPYYDERVKKACHKSIFPLAFSLYRELLAFDVEAQLEQYASVDRKAEKQRLMTMDGIPVEG